MRPPGDAPAATSGERRRGDRRRTDRRLTGRDDALFGTTLGADSQDSTFFDAGWMAAGDVPMDDQRLLRHVRRMAAAQDSALARVVRTYAAARAAIGVGLVLAQGLSSLFGVRTVDWLAPVSLAYAAQAITLWLLPRYRTIALPQASRSGRRRQWLATIGVDLVAFSALHVINVGASFNYAALLVLPVLMAGVLTSRLMALGTAAAVALMLLAVALQVAQAGTAVPELLLQSGLAGLGLFIITLISGEMAGRLAREELAARGSLELARQQAQLNRLVIEEMADGVLVIDRRLRVRAANPAARALLVAEGLSPPAPFGLGDRSWWAPLAEQVALAFGSGDWPEGGREVALAFDSGQARTLRLRVRFMQRRDFESEAERGGASAGGEAVAPDEPFIVLLLDDARTVQARLRQEKLAAMGRVSAGIAHEIRNPLAAIAQANALMQEDELSAAQQRLAGIVADNVQRLKRLVDDVMEVAPGAPPVAAVVDVAAAVAGTAEEWAAANGVALGPGSRLQSEIADAGLLVAFDAEHLRRVLVNLLDNAARHATGGEAAIALRLAAAGERHVRLAVLSDGEPIAADVERHLFEPFFSTRSRGSGLGLYICRELCERYGASIEYRSLPAAQRWRKEFVVTLRLAGAAGAAGSDGTAGESADARHAAATAPLPAARQTERSPSPPATATPTPGARAPAAHAPQAPAARGPARS